MYIFSNALVHAWIGTPISDFNKMTPAFDHPIDSSSAQTWAFPSILFLETQQAPSR
jgi:hypothetical protein